jgi:hypothetical protein
MEARLHTATPSDDVYSMISAHRLEDLIHPRFFWLLFELQESLKAYMGSCFDLCIDDLAEEFAGGSDV